jgi:hypothetical protein
MALAAAALCAVGASAQTAREIVSAQLLVIIDTKAEDGFTADTGALGRPTLRGVLEHDTTVHFELTLEAGREYFIAARCDEGCVDLDARILAPDFSPLAGDTLDNDVPNIAVTAAETGPHLLAVRMVSCRTDICYFGVAVVSRPAR